MGLKLWSGKNCSINSFHLHITIDLVSPLSMNSSSTFLFKNHLQFGLGPLTSEVAILSLLFSVPCISFFFFFFLFHVFLKVKFELMVLLEKSNYFCFSLRLCFCNNETERFFLNTKVDEIPALYIFFLLHNSPEANVLRLYSNYIFLCAIKILCLK